MPPKKDKGKKKKKIGGYTPHGRRSHPKTKGAGDGSSAPTLESAAISASDAIIKKGGKGKYNVRKLVKDIDDSHKGKNYAKPYGKNIKKKKKKKKEMRFGGKYPGMGS